MNEEELNQLFDFFREIEKEKQITRQTFLADGSRKENDAEHAWHMAIMAYLLQEYANQEVDIGRVMILCLIHDIVAIEAGDTYAYDEEAKKTQAERERKAAEHLFAMLPEDQCRMMHELFDEFEHGDTPEARFARAMDNFQPLLLNDANQGESWMEHEVARSSIDARQKKTAEG